MGNRHIPLVLTAVLLSGCESSEAPLAGGLGPPVPAARLQAETALPPGQSGFVSLAGQVQGLLTGNPADYGAHLDDQRLLYWRFDAKPGALGTRPGSPEQPIEGVEIYRDDFGVPIVYADQVRDLWFGVGYAVAQDRLFLMDAVRRMGRGTSAALLGCGSVPADLQQRTLAYTDAEYAEMFERLSPDAQAAVQGYVDGANAWIDAIALRPDRLPAEYVLLTAQPEPFTVPDVLAAGVFITRFVASEGGQEFSNLRLLRGLESVYGSRETALRVFQDLIWLEDPQAAVSIPREEGTFSNQPTPESQREAVFRARAEWALGLPDTLASGPGTGAADAPFPCSQPSLPGPLGAAGGLGAGGVRLPKAAPERPAPARLTAVPGRAAPPPASPAAPAAAPAAGKATAQAEAMAQLQRQLVQALAELRRGLHGGSFGLALGPTRTADGGTLLISAPQLGYSYPLLLVEYEIQGAGYAARGSSVPLLPVVGIGYSEHVAWALTTGYSKTIDSFILPLCSSAQQSASTCSRNQVLQAGVWTDLSCRSETLPYRAAVRGVPVGPAALSVEAEVCRSVYGPVVARDEAAGLARALAYAMFGREIDTLEGIREWNRAKTFSDFDAAMENVTWNENTVVATRDGHIAYYHPGLHPRRHPETDQRLPIPGTGDFDHAGLLSFAETPQVIDPAQGFVANWNNKPAFGWLDGDGFGSTSRPGGPGQRVTNLLDTLASRDDWTFADLREIDRLAGVLDPRAREYRPVMARLPREGLSEVQLAALDAVLAWDGAHYAADIDIEDENARDTVGATLFDLWVQGIREELFAPLRQIQLAPDFTAFDRIRGVGSHVFDQSVMDNVALRVLDPRHSGLTLRHDFAAGRDADTVLRAALDRALGAAAEQFNNGTPLSVADLAQVRRIHPRSEICSLSGVIGPGSSTVPGTACVTMPYQDRGSWVHRVGYTR